MAAADRVACNHSDDGLGTGADHALEVQNIEARHAVAADIAAIAANFLVTARAESQGAGAGQNNDADGGIFASVCESLAELQNGFRTKGVAHARSIDGQFGDTFGFFIKNVGKFAGRLPIQGTFDFNVFFHDQFPQKLH